MKLAFLWLVLFLVCSSTKPLLAADPREILLLNFHAPQLSQTQKQKAFATLEEAFSQAKAPLVRPPQPKGGLMGPADDCWSLACAIQRGEELKAKRLLLLGLTQLGWQGEVQLEVILVDVPARKKLQHRTYVVESQFEDLQARLQEAAQDLVQPQDFEAPLVLLERKSPPYWWHHGLAMTMTLAALAQSQSNAEKQSSQEAELQATQAQLDQASGTQKTELELKKEEQTQSLDQTKTQGRIFQALALVGLFWETVLLWQEVQEDHPIQLHPSWQALQQRGVAKDFRLGLGVRANW